MILILCAFLALLGVADELLATPDECLEANSRKLKHMCYNELRFISNIGRFMPNRPSKLWGFMNSLADCWLGDTQLVEAINSMVRLIGNRCPRIDLSSMSSRITVKKSILPMQSHLKASAKRWSSVREHAAPMLQDLLQSGHGFKTVLHARDRFAPVVPVSCLELHSLLGNQDILKAVPIISSLNAEIKGVICASVSVSRPSSSAAASSSSSLLVDMSQQADANAGSDSGTSGRFVQDALHWAHQHAIRWKRVWRDGDGHDNDEDYGGRQFGRVSTLVALFPDTAASETQLCYVHASSSRSIVQAAIMTVSETCPQSRSLLSFAVSEFSGL